MRKGDLAKEMCMLLTEWKNQSMEVKYVRMDNAGENRAFYHLMRTEEWKLYPTIEFTAARTPQQNSLVEVAFTTIIGRMLAVVNHANLPPEIKAIIMPQCIIHCTYMPCRK